MTVDTIEELRAELRKSLFTPGGARCSKPSWPASSAKATKHLGSRSER